MCMQSTFILLALEDVHNLDRYLRDGENVKRLDWWNRISSLQWLTVPHGHWLRSQWLRERTEKDHHKNQFWHSAVSPGQKRCQNPQPSSWNANHDYTVLTCGFGFTRTHDQNLSLWFQCWGPKTNDAEMRPKSKPYYAGECTWTVS